MFTKFKEKFIGTREFYSYVLAIAVPMILQNVVTNFVSLLDNIMVGQIGTDQMSGVAIANQFFFVFNITIFGAVSGPGIFGSQFRGKGDMKGQMYTFRFRVIMAAIIVAIAAFIFKTWDTELISLYLSEAGEAGNTTLALQYGKEYMGIMIWCLIPFAFGQAYASVLRECEETRIPMIGSISAVGLNLFLDYSLIFGKFGFPEMGVKGAAIATVVAKFIEAGVVIIWAHLHTERVGCMEGLYKSLFIPFDLVKNMIIKGTPLLMNEFFWALGMAVLNQCYAYRGLEVVAAQNISGTLTNLFGMVYLQLGASISIIVGQKLGSGNLEEAKDTDYKMIAFSVFVCIIVTIIMLPIARFFPLLYKTEQVVRDLATYFIIIVAFAMPMWAFTNACYFTLRSGGKTGITFIFDSVYTWVIIIPLVFVLSRFSPWSIRVIFAMVTYVEVIKCTLGFFMVRSGVWIKNLVDD